VDGDVAEERIDLVMTEPLRQEAGPSRGVHDGPDPGGALDTPGVGEAEGDAIGGEGDVEDTMVLEHRRSAPRRVAQEDVVARLPEDLVGLGVGVSTPAVKSAYCSVALP
jgi:hypothetical protein